MPIFHRKLLSDEGCDDNCNPPPSPPKHFSPFLILILCALSVLFGFIFYFTLSTRHRRRMTNNNPRANLDETRQDFVVEEQGPMVDHPIWLIRTVGLEQSLIDSIEVFKYKKSERLIDGTECSVCLSEFQDDESLRLLPKCSHAFHIPCIDTWLRSHKNCPFCRAPIVRSNAQERTVDSSSPNGPSSSSEVSSENGEGSVELAQMRSDAGVENGEQGQTIGEGLRKSLPPLGSNPIRVRVKSDLADYRGNAGGDPQPMRRSISMDASSASMIYLAVANMPVMEEEEAQEPRSSMENNRLVGMKNPNPAKSTKEHKRSSSSIYDRVMKSSSRRLSISMKRSYSYSSNGKSSLQPL